MTVDQEHSQPNLGWLYEGIWGVLTGIFCVPRQPPQLPAMAKEGITSRKPSVNFLNYCKIELYIVLAVVSLPLIIGATIAAIVNENGWLMLLPIAAVIVTAILWLLGYLAIYLRYDTMWYVFSDRSMRLRRGIWIIRESTITFENIQNVKVVQGPLQRIFGIANVIVETAGGGGSHAQGGGDTGMHSGVIEGITDAAAIRDAIMNKVRTAQSAGLGDEAIEQRKQSAGWSATHLTLLAEIRDLAKQAAAADSPLES